MGTIRQDLRFGIRQLVHHPGFTLTVIFTLALAIGILELVCLAIYLIPQTSVLGAILLNTARGGVNLIKDGNPLIGEFTMLGAFSPADWAQLAAAGTTWNGGVWMTRHSICSN